MARDPEGEILARIASDSRKPVVAVTSDALFFYFDTLLERGEYANLPYFLSNFVGQQEWFGTTHAIEKIMRLAPYFQIYGSVVPWTH